jgi:hypothetical protein
VTTVLRRLLAFAAVAILAVLGLDALGMHAYRYRIAERQVRLHGAAALKHIAQRERTHPAAALIRRQRRAALEAKGYVVREEFVLSSFTVRTHTPKPADSVVTRVADWLYPPVHANAWDCWEGDEYIDGCDDGGGDDGGGMYVDIYPFDTGDDNTTAVDTEMCDDYGACTWDEVAFDNSSGDQDSILNSLRNYYQAWTHERVNPSASFLGMPCSADGNPSHVNPAITPTILAHAVGVCLAGAGYMAATACTGTGPAYLVCLGDSCGYPFAATILSDNIAFTGACHP